MGFEIDGYLSRNYHTGSLDLAEQMETLAGQLVPPQSRNAKLYRDMLLTVTRIAQADRSRWEAKILLQTLREMENAFRALDQFKRRRKVTVFGSARTPAQHPVYQLAVELGAALARRDLMVTTGAGEGIMAAAHEGAGLSHSLGLNITLPFEQRANDTVHDTGHVLTFHFFFLRKLFFVKEADALVLCPGGFGTLDEALEVLTLIQTGKSPVVPIILLDQPGGNYWQGALDFIHQELEGNGYILASDLKLMRLVHSAEAAVEEITSFYRNFHSSRWFRQHFVLRMNHTLTVPALQQLHSDFADILTTPIQQLPQANADFPDDTELAPLPRLLFGFNGRDHGRLRELIDFVNQPAHWTRA